MRFYREMMYISLVALLAFPGAGLFAQDAGKKVTEKTTTTQARPVGQNQNQSGIFARPPSVNQGNFKSEGGTRVVSVVEDRDQDYMISKVYVLKNASATDVRPYLYGAVFRANPQSNVQRLNYKVGGKQYLVVNMPIFMIPYIDDLVEKLDRPVKFVKKKGEPYSTIDGTGITHYEYMPVHRSTQDMLNIIRMFRSHEAAYWMDTGTNLIYGKNSKSDAADVDRYVRILDRPIPQVEMRINVYEVNESSLTELGLDFIRWKNGPGADLLNIGADLLNFKNSSEFFGQAVDLFSRGGNTWTGFLVAPDWDISFLRLLAQKGRARVATSGTLVVTNDYYDPGLNFDAARFRIAFSPQYQNISKNGEQEITLAHETPTTLRFFLRSPVICFTSDLEHQKAAMCTFGWALTTASVVERDNNGLEATNTNIVNSYMSIAPGVEKIITSFKRREKVNQNNGMPFLLDIPGLKYIFGSTTDSYAYYRYFVTLETRNLPPRPNLSLWAGNLIDVCRSFKETDPIEKEVKASEPAIEVEKTIDGNGVETIK